MACHGLEGKRIKEESNDLSTEYCCSIKSMKLIRSYNESLGGSNHLLRDISESGVHKENMLRDGEIPSLIGFPVKFSA